MYKEAYKREYGLSHVYPDFPDLSLGRQRMWGCVAATVKAAVNMGIADRTTRNDYGDV